MLLGEKRKPALERGPSRSTQSEVRVNVPSIKWGGANPTYPDHRAPSIRSSNSQEELMSTQDGGTPVTLRGASGRNYVFKAYPKHYSWNAVAGNYAILRQVSGGTVVYVGETENLRQRIACHHQLPCFDRNAWTHLAFLGEGSASRRRTIELDLMAQYKPTCNREV